MQKFLDKRTREEGFTLAEIMIALGIFSILVSIAVVGYIFILSESEEARVEAHVLNTVMVIEDARATGGGVYPEHLPQVVVGDAQTNDWQVEYRTSSNGQRYCLSGSSPDPNSDVEFFVSHNNPHPTTTSCWSEL